MSGGMLSVRHDVVTSALGPAPNTPAFVRFGLQDLAEQSKSTVSAVRSLCANICIFIYRLNILNLHRQAHQDTT